MEQANDFKADLARLKCLPTFVRPDDVAALVRRGWVTLREMRYVSGGVMAVPTATGKRLLEAGDTRKSA